jgi:hypothetical protein
MKKKMRRRKIVQYIEELERFEELNSKTLKLAGRIGVWIVFVIDAQANNEQDRNAQSSQIHEKDEPRSQVLAEFLENKNMSQDENMGDGRN